MMPLALGFSHAQPSGAEATLYGTIHDGQGKPLALAIVRAQRNGDSTEFTTHADAEGNYKLNGLEPGVYNLRIACAGYSDATAASVFLSAGETKRLDFNLQAAKGAASTPQFFDEPQFTVSGVTDTTSLGGHGSDTIVRTKDSLAKETIGLTTTQPASKPGSAGADEQSLREVIQRDARDFEANSELGGLLLDEGKSSDAIPYLQRAAEVQPNNYRNSLNLALAYLNSGDFSRGRKTAQSLLPDHDTAPVHHLLGQSDEKLGDLLGAVREYERAAQLDPSEPNLFDWGSELLLHHAPEPAIQVFTKGAQLFPRSTRMLVGLGAAEFARGAYEAAAERICQASDLNPDDPTPYRFLGIMQQAGSVHSDEVIARLRRFATLHPESAEANYYYAVAMRNQKKGLPDDGRAEVESLLERATRIDPKFGPAYLQLGILHLQQEDLAGAIADFRQAIQCAADPSVVEEAHYRLARAYRDAGHTEQAKAEIQAYQKLAQESSEQSERERHQIRQFVYTLRDQPPTQSH
jgi:tetratricopeptide (TPR) repeat protein